MGLQASFYRHPFATMITAVFLFSLLGTTVYFLNLYPGAGKTQSKVTELFITTVILFVATVVSWITAIGLSSENT